jgi:hypothetical protein
MGPQRGQRGALVGEVVVTVAPGCDTAKLCCRHRSALWHWKWDHLCVCIWEGRRRHECPKPMQVGNLRALISDEYDQERSLGTPI